MDLLKTDILPESQIAPGERRQQKRFQVLAKSSFVLPPGNSISWELVDISAGGLACLAGDLVFWPNEELCNGTITGCNDSSLVDFPMRRVAHQTLDIQENGQPLIRFSFMFGPLSTEQKFRLDCFIWINSIINC